MRRTLIGLLITMGVMAGDLRGQQAQFPDTPQGRIAAAFFVAANAPDDEALGRFQEANFSPAALRRRSAEHRAAYNRQLREDAGFLTPLEIRSASASQVVVVARGSNLPPGTTLTFTFTFTGTPPKVDRLDVR
jgi:hypothetical protein